MFFNDNFPINFPENSSWKPPKKPPVFIEAAAELETTAATMRLSDSMSKSTEARSGGGCLGQQLVTNWVVWNMFYPLVNIQKTMENIGKSPFLMGKYPIMAIFNSYVKLPEGICVIFRGWNHQPKHEDFTISLGKYGKMIGSMVIYWDLSWKMMKFMVLWWDF